MLVPGNTTIAGLRTVHHSRILHIARRDYGLYLVCRGRVSLCRSLAPVELSRCTRHSFGPSRSTVAAAKNYATVQDSFTTSTSSDPFSAAVPPTAQEPSKPPARSQIRDSLRTWGAQNDRIKSQSLSDTIPPEGKIARLPNALFVSEGDENLSEEAEQRYDDAEDSIDYVYGDLMRPGTLISYASALVKRQYVVYLGDIGQQSLLLLEKGGWAAEKMTAKRATFSRMRYMAVPDFLTPEEVNTLVAHLPKQDVVRSAGEGLPSCYVDVVGMLPDYVTAPMRDKFRAWSEEVDAFARDHKSQFDHIFDLVALPDKWRRIRLEDLPPLILGRSLESMTDAAKMALMSQCSKVHPLLVTVQVASSVDFLVGPKNLDESIRMVFDWARLYQEAAAQAATGKDVSRLLRDNPLSAFIDKARRIILKSRQIRSPTDAGVLGLSISADGPSDMEKVSTGEIFTSDDQRIIAYLQDVSIRRPVGWHRVAQASLIIRAVGAYPGLELKDHVIRMLLQEIGALDPWERVIDLSLPLPNGPLAEEMKGFLHRALQSVNCDDRSMSTVLPDTMGHMRKDWESLQAFCIDSKLTRNVEDAISIEPATSHPGAYWVRVHLSHMTARLHPEHPVAQLARRRGAAFYSNSGGMTSQTMVPASVISHCAVGPDALVLTVSTLIDDEGIVHDVNVTPAIIRHVVNLDAESVRHVMSDERDEEAVLVVGKTPEPRYLKMPAEEDIEAVNKHLPTLELLQRLLKARLKRRQKEVATPADIPLPPASRVIYVDSSAPQRTMQNVESYHWKGDPGITVRTFRKVNMSMKFHERRAWDVVTQSMRIASESLAKWLTERSIPAVFIGSDVTASFSIEKANNRGQHEMISLPPISRTSTPRPWVVHNMQQYVACTSPMRKFIDTVTLFQVDAYLKAQAQGLIAENAAVQDESILTFSKAEIDQFLADDVAPMDTVQGFNKRQDSIWLYQALYRAFHLKQADLPKIMEVLVDLPRRRDAQGKLHNVMGTLIPWGGVVELEPTAQGFEDTAKFHHFVAIELIRVDPVGLRIFARAVGPPTEEQQFVDPLRCYRHPDTQHPAVS